MHIKVKNDATNTSLTKRIDGTSYTNPGCFLHTIQIAVKDCTFEQQQ